MLPFCFEMTSMSYIGRFAPSPSGPLHFGSLIAALGSYFQAKSQHGQWLVRIEDLDPPREMPGAADLILKTLETYHLFWDGEVVYQSQRHHLYQAQIDQWLRKQIKEMGGYYNGHCQELHLDEGAIRLKMTQPITHFDDLRHGQMQIPLELAQEDFIIKRRDGLFAYNLAVVLDDIDQGVTEVVRGADLMHLPLAMDKNGNKLSKQNHATGIDLTHPASMILEAMAFLGFAIPKELHQANLDEILRWGVQNWHLNQLPESLEITARFSNGTA